MFTLNCKGRLLTINSPLVMGIINTTPDSFYSGSRFTADTALQQAEQLLNEGAAILDIGGQSTRPGASILTAAAEAERVLPVISAIRNRFPESVISVDTYYAEVATAAVETGADIVNDISGGSFDPQMLPAVGALNVPYICMHLHGDAATMHHVPAYQDVLTDVFDFFTERIAACTAAGIKDIILDPGLGFSKTIAHNFRILEHLQTFRVFGKPLLIGLSRKSTIYKTLGITAAEALNGTTVLNTVALLNGASILRVHDAKEAKEAIALLQQLKEQGN
ncbi:dihydropteroate synthase [Sediminibacterium ginsengisoli]|uniref:dihydropteroate synthase n=1 Tax=Sediminibacterium ginsengisoli TaxID=413434 RepID=A0A1T4RBV4_9BACT|nr:dihydropteroate synthase [Sediminibacterium ginsengisoli]SKA13296.1 dihydropteroate synthase [Sediminibacterium ginsengisoli]